MTNKRLLLVEDDRALADLVTFHFERSGYDVTRTGDGEEALILVDEVKPDVLVEDNVVLFPELATSGAPFVRIVSCNPLEMPGDGLPPRLGGLPMADPDSWEPFRRQFDKTHRAMWEAFNSWVVEQGADPLPELEFMPYDNAANIYV